MILKLKDTTLEFLTGMDKSPWLINLKTFDLLQYVDMTLKMLPKENNVVFFKLHCYKALKKIKYSEYIIKNGPTSMRYIVKIYFSYLKSTNSTILCESSSLRNQNPHRTSCFTHLVVGSFLT